MIPLPVPYGEHPPAPAAVTQVFSETALRLLPQTTEIPVGKPERPTDIL